MEIESLRLELLKLTYTHGRDIPEIVERARGLEAYVKEQASDAKRSTLSLKKPTNAKASG
jgi:hypothetical protein